MIKIIGQATQKDGTTPVWTLTGVCKSAARTDTGTYTISLNFNNKFGIDNKNKISIFVSAERGGVGTERYVIDWINSNTFRIRNYSAYNSTALGDCRLTVTIIANIEYAYIK